MKKNKQNEEQQAGRRFREAVDVDHRDGSLIR